MAKQINVLLIDDLDGTSIATETVEFGLDGTTYEIDLTAKNATKLRDALRPFADKAERKSGPRNGVTRGKGTNGSGSHTSGKASEKARTAELAKIRQWARDNGHTVGDKGRVPAAIEEAYLAAQ